MSFLRIDILGTLPIAYSLGNNVTINIGELYGSYNSFNCPISLSAGNVSLFRSIYNKKLVVTKTANSNTNGWGGNIYNDTLDVTNASTGTIMLGNFVNDSLKGDVWVSNTSTGYIAFGHSNNGTKAVLLSGKKFKLVLVDLIPVHWPFII
ncbi:MAG: hypothetical protein M0D57_10415 [Sphingobacteriales bacterium JAD_PAG50586_3]|nr:MAG: hypothetical protein M0D57_10415 [Sphingobacteriales bacterium JAD_PAG50586_3]